jgi:DNA-binding transcriptional LysR family regulator
MLFITAVNLQSVDLNLFYVLHVVLAERSATRAAKRLHVTQSAVSNALGRLRDLFGDPLLVRQSLGLVPTPRALALAPLIAAAVGDLERALGPGAGFDPADTRQTFTLAAADTHQAYLVPSIAARFERAMPRASLRIVSSDFLVATDGLASGAVDAVLAPQTAGAPRACSRVVLEERGVLLVRRDHPRVKRRMTKALFNELRHIEVQVVLGATGTGHRVASQHWARAGLRRDVALAVPYFITAALVAAKTDFVAAVPDRLAELFATFLPLKIAPATFAMPTLVTALVWHPRTDTDPAARHFRQVIFDAVAARPP